MTPLHLILFLCLLLLLLSPSLVQAIQLFLGLLLLLRRLPSLLLVHLVLPHLLSLSAVNHASVDNLESGGRSDSQLLSFLTIPHPRMS